MEIALRTTGDRSFLIGGLKPILMQSDWKDRKGRFAIHYIFDGMCPRDTFLIVSRIEFVVLVVFVLFLGAFDTWE